MNGFPLHAGKDALPAGPDPAEHAAYVRTTDPEADLSTFDGAVLLYQGRLTRSAYVPRPPPPGVGARRPAPGRAPGPQIRPVRWIRPRRPGRRPRRRATRRSRHPADHHRRHRRFPPAQPPARRPCRCTSALRDEGLSHHYLPPGRTASPSPALTRHLTEALATYDVLFTSGPVWTMDAPYRETTVEVSRYGADGILAADMEAAAGLRRGPLPYGRRRHRRGHRGLPRRPPPAPALAGHRARPSRRTGGSGTGTSRLHRVTADLRRTLGLNSS